MEENNKTNEIEETEIIEPKKKKPLKENLRNNPFIVTTMVLLILAIMLIVSNIIEDNEYNVSKEKMICSVIYATPAWAVDGRIVEYGVVILNDTSIDLVGTELIPNNITFVYQDGCSACEAQIDYFKEQGTWDAYVDSGLTLNCKGLM